jgi:hypothetical protein
MGLLQKIIQNWKERQQETEEQDDNVTKDRYLRSLRRERRIQFEEVEKENLKRLIAEYKKRKMQENVWGIRNELVARRAAAGKKKTASQKASYMGRYRL